jgi:azurin/glucose/arabinose dehydrogenase
MIPTKLLAALAMTLLGGACAAAGAEPLLSLAKGDHVAIVGSGLADRQQHHGWLEAMIHAAHPELDLTIRNLGFAADEINLHPRSDDVPTTEYFLSMRKGETPGTSGAVYIAGTDFGADVILAYWGFNEAFKGPGGLPEFTQQLDDYLAKQAAAKYNGKSAPRVVLLSPIAHEDLKSGNFPDGAANNANLALYAKAMQELAARRGVAFVDLFTPSQALYAASKKPLTINGIHLTEDGDRQLAAVQFKALFARDPLAAGDPKLAKVRQAVLAKNTQWHHRYRSVDQFNIYGERSRIPYEGVTNAVILGQEMAQRDVLTANRDLRIWALAKGRDLAVKDDNLPPVNLTPPNRPAAVPYQTGEGAIAGLKLAEGIKVELVASEETFPELVNPVQMAFDTRGRLWIAAWPNYPGTTPTTKVFDLDPATGKAAKVTTFMDGLNCPTGFQFYKDGVLLMQSPDLLWVRDTDGDGKADSVERMLHGLDAADSHHETNSMCLEPGGAVYLSDGVFHRTNVETPYGPIRNRDGAIYRYEPNTGKFTRHVPYGFANPHGRVFDRWGNDLITDATGNDNYFGPAFSGHLSSGGHPHMKTFWDRPSRPCAGTAILSSRHFPDDWQGSFLNANVISLQGIFRAKLSDEGSAIKGETMENLVAADLEKNPNFRPSGITVAPDGSLYFMDWSQMLIGHLQHHLRDPNRDHQHGRIYRITYQGRPLLVPKKVFGEPIPKLLELLKEPENDVRMRAKIELGKFPAAEVAAAAKAWVKSLDPKAPDYEHHVLEALWVHQWHNQVDLDLLARVLKSPDPRARAQGVRVIGYWNERVPNALALVKAAAGDASPRVRLEAVRVASFFPQWEAADAALAALQHPRDYYLDYCLGETLRELEGVWKQAIRDGKPLAANNPAGVSFLLDKVGTADLGKLPPSVTVYTAILTREDAAPEARSAALAELAKLGNVSRVSALVGILKPIASDNSQLARVIADMLLLEPAADLKSERALLQGLISPETPTAIRQRLTATVILTDGSLDPSWAEALKSPGALSDWLGAIQLLSDPSQRSAAFGKIHPLLATLPEALSGQLQQGRGVSGRVVRISLPRKGTLSLAEVQVVSEGKEVSRSGKARQSSTAYDGAASRAIDGKTDGSFSSATITHTNENEQNPWWEVDLGADLPLDSVSVWNRTDENGRYVERMDGFELSVLDSTGSEVFKQSSIPAAATAVTITMEGNSRDTLRRQVVNALLATKADPEKLFLSLADMLAKQDLVAASARAIRQMPREAWAKPKAGAAIAGITTWAANVPTAARTSPEFLETLQLAEELVALLPAEQAAAARKSLSSLTIPVFRITAVREQLRFDRTRVVVAAGKPFEIVFDNPDAMPHNLLVLTPGTSKAVAETVQTFPPDKLDHLGRAYVPDNDPRVLAATKLLAPGASETLRITAPEAEGTYEFICSFPGHWNLMSGTLVVTKDPAAYLLADPEK